MYPIKTKYPSQKPIGFNGTGDNFLRYHPSCVKTPLMQCTDIHAPNNARVCGAPKRQETRSKRLDIIALHLLFCRSVCPHESIHIGIRYRAYTVRGSLCKALLNDLPKLLLSIIGLKYYDMIIPLNELQFKYISKIFYVRIITNAIAAA